MSLRRRAALLALTRTERTLRRAGEPAGANMLRDMAALLNRKWRTI